MSRTSHSSSGKHFNVVSYNSVLEQVSNLPDNKWMIYVLRHSHGLEDYATAKGSVKLKKEGKILHSFTKQWTLLGMLIMQGGVSSP